MRSHPAKSRKTLTLTFAHGFGKPFFRACWARKPQRGLKSYKFPFSCSQPCVMVNQTVTKSCGDTGRQQAVKSYRVQERLTCRGLETDTLRACETRGLEWEASCAKWDLS